MSTNGSFYQNGLPISTLETGLGNVPTGAPIANKASSSFYLSGTAYTQADPTLAAASASAAAASAAAAAASAASVPALLSSYAPLASPALTGAPTAPTATVSTNTAQLATTAFVLGQLATAAPLIDGTAAVGTSKLTARQDHVHPTDTSRAPTASPTFTGILTAGDIFAVRATNQGSVFFGSNNTQFLQYDGTNFILSGGPLSGTAITPTAGDSSTKIATTAFVTNSTSAAWTAYTPTVGAQTGTITTSSATGAYLVVGKLVFFKIAITITTNGTGATAVQASVPLAADDTYFLAGRANGISGKMLLGRISGTGMAIANYDNTYPAVSGEVLLLTGYYRTT